MKAITGSAPAPHRSQAQGSAHVPGDRITVHLQELQELLGLLSISCFLLGRERVIGDQQGVGPATWGGKDQKSGCWEGPARTEVGPSVEGLYNYSNKDKDKHNQNTAFRCPHSLTTILRSKRCYPHCTNAETDVLECKSNC